MLSSLDLDGTWFNVFSVLFSFQVYLLLLNDSLYPELLQNVEVMMCLRMNRVCGTGHCPRVFAFAKLYGKVF